MFNIGKRILFASCVGLAYVQSAFAVDFIKMNFRESEPTAEHLYRVMCFTAESGSTCTLRVMSVRTEKSTLACTINADTLFENEPAKREEGGTFVVAVTKGACGYTNTYVFNKLGMVQTKTSPAEIPEQLKSACSSFAPKTYNIPPNSGSLDMFTKVPIGKCPQVNVTLW